MKMPIATKSRNPRNGAENRYPSRNRSLAAVVVLTLLTALVGTTAYEYLKHILIPNATILESHAITICVGALLAAGAVYVVQRRHHAMLRALADEEELLRESEQDLSITLHSIGDAVIATDTDGRVVRMNPVAEQLTGWALAEAAGRPLADIFRIVNARTRAPVADPLEKAMKTGEVVALGNDTALIARDGAERQIADSAAPIRDAQGRIRGAVLVFHDVTAEYGVKKALRRLAVIAEQAAEGIAVGDLDGNLQFVNDAWARMHGYESGAELVGKHLRVFHTDEQMKTEVAPFNATAKRQGHNWAEVGHVRRDGTTFPTQMSVIVLKDEQGEPYGLAAFAEDITHRKRAEEELRGSREFLNKILNCIRDPIFVMNDQKRYILMNDAGRALVGLSREDLLGQTTRELFPPEIAESLLARNEKVLATGLDEVTEEQLPGTQGRQLTVITKKSLYQDARGNRYVVGIVRDITERKRAEEELRTSQARFSQLADNSGEWIWEVDGKGLYTYSSPAVESVLGFTPEEVVGKKHFYDFFAPQVREELLKFAADAMARKAPFKSWGNMNVHRNGRIVHLETSGVPVLDEKGNVLGYRGVDVDITERKKAQEALQEASQFNQEIIANAQEGIIVCGPDLKGRIWNPFMEQLTGLPASAVLGRHPVEVFPFLHAAGVIERIERALAGETPGAVDFPYPVQKTGRTGWASDTSAPIRNRQGEVVGVITTVHDITERKRAEEELRETNEHLVQLIARLNTTTEELKALMRRVVEDQTFTGRFANPLILRCWEAKKCNQLTCPAYGRSDDLRCWETAGTFCKGKVQGQFALKLKDCCKCEVYQAARADPICDLGETFNNMMAIIRERNLDIEAMNRKLEQASAAKSYFLANVSHEIRTPMTAILGFTEMLSSSIEGCARCPDHLSCPVRVQNKESLQIIQRNGEHLLALINDILDLSKIEAGKQGVELQPCRLTTVLADTASVMWVRARERGIELSVEFAGPLPETIVTDETRVRQALMNLVGNAVKFTERGGVRVVTSFLPNWRDAQPAVRMQVLDSGIGITAETLARLFQPFTQADFSTSRQYGGTGLGLAISRRIATLLGGELAAESAPGKGSTFTLTIPTGSLEGVRMFDNPSEAMQAEHDRPAPAPISDRALAGLRILLAEDGPDNQRLICTILGQAGAEVEVAENGRVAVEKAQAAGDRPFDVILMDMRMPEMDGYEAARTLRAQGHKGPILALTACTMTGDRRRCLEAGCDDHLAKPIQRVNLIAMIAGWAGRDPVAGDGSPEAPAPEAISSQFANDSDLAGILDEFVAALPGKVRAMRQALAGNGMPELARMAHQLKGAGGGYGYPSLTDCARTLEEAAKAQDVEAAGLRLSDLTRLCQAIARGLSDRRAAKESGK